MRVTRVLFLLSALALLLPTHSEAQFRRNTVPTIPPPTITEYNPRSTLVVPEHGVGGYTNTGWDLVSNLVGAAAMGVWIRLRG